MRKVVLRRGRSHQGVGWWMRVSYIGKKFIIIKIGVLAFAVFSSLKNENCFVKGFFILVSGRETRNVLEVPTLLI